MQYMMDTYNVWIKNIDYQQIYLTLKGHTSCLTYKKHAASNGHERNQLLLITLKSAFSGTKKFGYILKLFKHEIQSLQVLKSIFYYRKTVKYEKMEKSPFFYLTH